MTEIFEGGKKNSLGKLKDIKNEFFHFNSIWF